MAEITTKLMPEFIILEAMEKLYQSAIKIIINSMTSCYNNFRISKKIQTFGFSHRINNIIAYRQISVFRKIGYRAIKARSMIVLAIMLCIIYTNKSNI